MHTEKRYFQDTECGTRTMSTYIPQCWEICVFYNANFFRYHSLKPLLKIIVGPYRNKGLNEKSVKILVPEAKTEGSSLLFLFSVPLRPQLSLHSQLPWQCVTTWLNLGHWNKNRPGPSTLPVLFPLFFCLFLWGQSYKMEGTWVPEGLWRAESTRMNHDMNKEETSTFFLEVQRLVSAASIILNYIIFWLVKLLVHMDRVHVLNDNMI